MDKHSLQNEINDMLRQMDGELPLEEEALPMEEPPPERILHVYIRDEPEESEAEETAVESTLEELASQPAQEQGIPPIPLAGKRRRKRLIFLLASLVCMLALISALVWYLLPFWMPTATITIVPVTKRISTTSLLLVSTDQSTPAENTIPGRTLATVTMSQEYTVSTTGKAHQDAQAAHGTITFYNGAPSVQTIPAGTLLTGTDGVQVVTDQAATIPAVVYPTLGQVTVTAHTVTTGPAGDIKAGDIYGPCCRLNVSAVNGAFTGGQEARDYQTATRQDISSAITSIKGSLDQSVQAALQTQVHPDETLLTPLSCQQNSKPDHQAGEEATQVHLTMSETCTGVVYNTQAYQDMITQILTQEATKQLGAGYAPTGTTQSSVTQATPKERGSIALQVKLAGTWIYQFRQEQQRHMKALIAGKSKAQATSSLLQISGVQSAAISMRGNGDRLPTDSKDIDLIFLMTL